MQRAKCQKPKALAYQQCALQEEPVEFGPDYFGWIGAGNPSSSEQEKWNSPDWKRQKMLVAFSLEPVCNLAECSNEINATGATGVPSRLHTSLECRRSAQCH
jgi:hypothetical protein